LRIAVLVKSFIVTGGSERYAVEVTRRLRARGHEIDVYARYVDESLLDGMRHVRVPDRHTYSSVANSLSFARESARLLRGKAYDIVHSHERGYCQDVMTIHTFSYRSGLNRYSFLRRIDQTYLSPRSAIYLWLENKQMASPGLVAVSGRIREDIRQYYNRTEGVQVITPGVDLERFHPEEMARYRKPGKRQPDGVRGDLTVLFVGAEFCRKGLDQLIPAIGDRMKLIVVGRGERLDHYRKLAVDCGAGDRIRFVGHVDGDIGEYYAQSDVVVLPSLREAFGMSILEAMACGLPVIASPLAGAADLIVEGENGFLARESQALQAALIRLRDPMVREEMGRKARQSAEAHSWERAAAEYESFFVDIFNSRSGRMTSRRNDVRTLSPVQTGDL
jgi:UDP-glucose:(heptosyl)LPS alpha-1,3-glucosyltransferase